MICESYNLQYEINFISVMPTNLYGENDNFDLEKFHILPALIHKIHIGKPRREFFWSEDMENRDFKYTYKNDQKEIRNKHIEIIYFKGEFYFNTDKPDGTMVKLTNPSKLHSLSWWYLVELEEGIRRVYEWYLDKNIS